ncbi:MAG: ATP-dependent DNA helicase RecG [Wenzhouxiangellaceae bacterium]|nr:ATP-dependent DNA helicase RecG [Wenzhouxiangellaceae bacterium]MBS3746015.1 ATP-dependent DNA helicase RecG [Wenzhouxiangellaceae bacterium]MBS3822377.1 ATP-dependent DNA helicase RecG [Wenzhouxiangellaceae bacterium]
MTSKPDHTSAARRIDELNGVGPALASKFKALGITGETGLLLHRPLRYEDRTQIIPINRVRPAATAQVQGRVTHQEIRKGRRRSLLVVLEDDHGQLVLRFFNFYPSQRRQFAVGNRLRCFGEVRFGPEGFEMAHPQCRIVREGAEPPLPDHLSPVYPTTAGLGQQRLAAMVLDTVQRALDGRMALDDVLDAPLDLPDLRSALAIIHRPGPQTDLDALIEGEHPAVQRLALEELAAHHLALARLNRARARQHAEALEDDRGLVDRMLAAFPFEPTGAQQRVMGEIGGDLAGTRPMRRLLQGDVGSGKTLVAAAAAAQAIGAGAQVAIIAPTEILAEQHLRNFREWFEPLGIEPVWLAGKVTGKKRSKALQQLAAGAPLAIGTHALFQEGVEFDRLRLVIVDEQHRFGVDQRLALAAKGSDNDTQRIPHQLVMTATPIPRTLAMTAYAGLEVSVIDELPPGRKPVTTAVIDGERRPEVIERIRVALADGRQAYWVCPLIEESDVLEAEAAETTAAELERQLPDFRVGLVHGRMKAAGKQATMDAFKAGEIRLLVATTVIEVGVDVPNASLMIIENAERLGLSQLHQLRGRVGRGSDKSACLLMYKAPVGELARARLKVMRETTDGFRIAERDLELRGPGEVLGTRQTGMLRFRIADLARDTELVSQVPPLVKNLTHAQADVLIERWIGDASQFADV